MILVDHFTRPVYGVPTGQPRRVKPVALACLHITGNRGTAAETDLHAAAQGERNYANGHTGGPSASHYIARDGWTIEAIDWKRYAAWSNGVVVSPNLGNAGIRRMLALKAKGYGANEAYWIETESVGYPRSYPVNEAQKQANAELIAAAARYSGLPINRDTVHGHFDVDSLDRNSCPDIHHEPFLLDVIAKANSLLLPDSSTEAAMTLLYRVLRPAVGTVTVSIDGAAIVTPDSRVFAAPKGSVRDCFAEVELLKPLDTRPGDRQKAWLVGKLSTETANSEVALLLAYAGTFTPTPVPPPDCSAAVSVAVAQTKASAKVVFT